MYPNGYINYPINSNRMDPLSQRDVAAIILSYLPDESLKLLHSLGVTPTLLVNSKDSLFWKRRVETLVRVGLEDIPRNWREIFTSLSKDGILHLRSSIDSVETLELLYSLGVTPTSSDLRFAVENDLPNSLQFILDEGSVDPNERRLYPSDERGHLSVAIVIAADEGYLRCVEILLADERVDPDIDEDGFVPLTQACCALNSAVPLSNYERIVQLLLDDPRVDPNQHGHNLFSAALSFEDNWTIIEILLRDIRLDPDLDDEAVQQAISISAAAKSLELLLADDRVQITQETIFGLFLDNPSPKILAVILESGRYSVTEELLQEILDLFDEGLAISLLKVILLEDVDSEVISNSLVSAVKSNNIEAVRLLLTDPRFDITIQGDVALRAATSPEVTLLIKNAMRERRARR